MNKTPQEIYRAAAHAAFGISTRYHVRFMNNPGRGATAECRELDRRATQAHNLAERLLMEGKSLSLVTSTPTGK